MPVVRALESVQYAPPVVTPRSLVQAFEVFIEPKSKVELETVSVVVPPVTCKGKDMEADVEREWS